MLLPLFEPLVTAATLKVCCFYAAAP